MNPDLVREVETLRNEFDDRPKPEIFSAVIDQFLSTPGLVGFWPMSSVQRSTGNAYDLSAQGRTLTYNGNPTYNIYNDFVPYIDLDGTGDYLSRADETDLDILGTESIYASAIQGLTVGGWFWFDTLGTVGLISKFNSTGNQRAYRLFLNTSSMLFQISTDGIATVSRSNADITIATGQWYFVVGRFITASEISCFVNDTETSSVIATASIFNSNQTFEIGRSESNASLEMDGRTSLCFLSANALSDAYINGLFEQSRVLFGV